MHTHHSCTCKHENVKFCQHCNTVYCVSCNTEWKPPCVLNHYWGWNPYYVNTGTGFNLYGLGTVNADNISTSLTSCLHEATNG